MSAWKRLAEMIGIARDPRQDRGISPVDPEPRSMQPNLNALGPAQRQRPTMQQPMGISQQTQAMQQPQGMSQQPKKGPLSRSANAPPEDDEAIPGRR